MSKEKLSRFEVSVDNKLNLNRIGLSEKEVSIFEFVLSISEFLNDENSIETIKKAVSENKDEDKILFVVLRENFNNDKQNIDDIPNVEALHKQFRKTFKKEKNVYAFIKNSYSLETKGVVDVVDTINITTDDFSSDVNRTLEDIERQKEQERLAEQERIRQEQEAAKKAEEERLAAEANAKLEEERAKEREEAARAKAADEGREYIPGEENIGLGGSQFDDEPLLGEKTEQEKLSEAEVSPNDFDIEFQDPSTSGLIVDEDLKISSNEYNLKSIFDFVWRMFILYNKENQLDNLIYNITSHTPLISYAQNDFIRDLSLEADSLFDMILKLDYKLKFNNNLFYLYLSNLYYVKNNKVIVNMEFVDNFMVWESEESRNEFIEKITKFVNENSELVSKVIYSHFIEYSSYIKSFIPRIRTSLMHKDIYKIILARNKYVQRFNIFKIIFENLNFICTKLKLNMNELIMNQDIIDQLDSDFKINIVKTYNVFLDEIRNFILLDGSTEENINLLYKELTNIGTSYLVDIFQSVVDEEVTAEDTLSSIISYEQEKLENEYNETQNPVYENVNIAYQDVEDLYNSVEEKDVAEEAKVNDEESKEDVIETINQVDGEELDVTNLIIEDQENKNYLYNNVDYPEDDDLLLGESSKTDNLESLLNDSKYACSEPKSSIDFEVEAEQHSDILSRLHAFDAEDPLVQEEPEVSFSSTDDDIKAKIDEYEKRIKANIEMIEQERKKIKEKTEKLKEMNLGESTIDQSNEKEEILAK